MEDVGRAEDDDARGDEVSNREEYDAEAVDDERGELPVELAVLGLLVAVGLGREEAQLAHYQPHVRADLGTIAQSATAATTPTATATATSSSFSSCRCGCWCSRRSFVVAGLIATLHVLERVLMRDATGKGGISDTGVASHASVDARTVHFRDAKEAECRAHLGI